MVSIITFLSGVVLGALSSWLITRYYYFKSSADQHAELEHFSENIRPRNTLEDFERSLGQSTWAKTIINNSVIWICEDNNTLQIEQGERTRDFDERWTTVFPDPQCSAYPVYLKVGDTIIKEFEFILLDGGRIFVPTPEVRSLGNGGIEYFWNIDSLEVKVCRIIGMFYIYNNLERVAQMAKVSIVKR